MTINRIEIQDENGNIYYPHTTTDVVFDKQGKSIEETLSEIVDIKKVQRQTIKNAFTRTLNEYYLPVNWFRDGWQIDDATDRAKKPNISDGKRWSTEFFCLPEYSRVTMIAPASTFQWCTIEADDLNYNNSIWKKLYAEGDTFVVSDKPIAIVVKNNEAVITEEEVKKIKFVVTNELYNPQVADIVKKINSKKYDLVMPFVTDIHHCPFKDLKWGGDIQNKNIKHLQSIIELTNRIETDLTIFGGDYSSDWNTMALLRDTLRKLNNVFDLSNSPVYCLAGNHDFGDGYNYTKTGEDAPLSPAELNQILGGKGSDTMYYYVDKPEKKIRVIALNTSDAYIPNSNGSNKYNRSADENIHVIRQEQAKWLAEVALNTPEDGWTVIITSHVPFRVNTHNAKAICSMLVARKNKTTVSLSNTDANSDFNITLSCDFRNYKTINLVGQITGHTHYDQSVVYEGVNVVSTTLLMGVDNFKGEVPDMKSTTFDVYCLDLTSKRIDIYRFGNIGSDRSITY